MNCAHCTKRFFGIKTAFVCRDQGLVLSPPAIVRPRPADCGIFPMHGRDNPQTAIWACGNWEARGTLCGPRGRRGVRVHPEGARCRPGSQGNNAAHGARTRRWTAARHAGYHSKLRQRVTEGDAVGFGIGAGRVRDWLRLATWCGIGASGGGPRRIPVAPCRGCPTAPGSLTATRPAPRSDPAYSSAVCQNPTLPSFRRRSL